MTIRITNEAASLARMIRNHCWKYERHKTTGDAVAVLDDREVERYCALYLTPHWNPIREAPRDGTEFIYYEQGEVSTCRRSEGDSDDLSIWWDVHRDQETNPEFWMPLPSVKK